MNALIEEYLRTTGLRYFRGHHDDEYFFLVDFLFVADAHHGRLHVHIEAAGPDRDVVQVSITPDRYYPAQARDRLTALAARWNAGHPGSQVVVRDSCDPALVGVLLLHADRPADADALASFVDETVSAGIELFGRMRQAVTELPQTPAGLRDAG
ncbi:MAG: hypothetical protein WCH82_05715 [Mycobacteriaceae bacterium]